MNNFNSIEASSSSSYYKHEEKEASTLIQNELEHLEHQIYKLYNEIKNQEETGTLSSPSTELTADADTDTAADLISTTSSTSNNTNKRNVYNEHDDVNNKTKVSRKILELKHSLNEKIIQLQARKEQNRVNDLLLSTMMNKNKHGGGGGGGAGNNKDNHIDTDADTDTDYCLLCQQLFPQLTKLFDQRVCEYFTCCGKAICKSCHLTYVRRSSKLEDEEDDNDDVTAIHNIVTTRMISDARETQENQKLQQENLNLTSNNNNDAIINDNQYEQLLNNHQCPFCKEPWSKNEFDDSQRILKLAKGGNSWAQVEIGRRYEHGMGVEPCEEAAAEWFQKATEQGDAAGQYNIGRFHKWGILPDDSSNNEDPKYSIRMAKHYFEKAARQGYGKAQHDLAALLVHGCETKQMDCCCADALHWYTLSILQGCDEALYGIGNLYLMQGKMKSDKLERASDFGRALFWLQQSAEKGLARGQMLLGLALLENAKNTYGDNLIDYTCSGFNVVPKVFYWLRRSSFNGELDAGTRLINCQNVHLKQCAFCHKTGDCQWRKCELCCGVSYCSVSCQAKDWDVGHHHDCYRDSSTPTGGEAMLIQIK